MLFWTPLSKYWCEHQERGQEADSQSLLQTATNRVSRAGQVNAEDPPLRKVQVKVHGGLPVTAMDSAPHENSTGISSEECNHVHQICSVHEQIQLTGFH